MIAHARRESATRRDGSGSANRKNARPGCSNANFRRVRRLADPRKNSFVAQNHDCRWRANLFLGRRSWDRWKRSLHAVEPASDGCDRSVAGALTRVCAQEIDIDSFKVNSEPRVSKNVGRLMVGIVIGFALVALYANIQKLRRAKIETVIFTPASAQSATPSPAPTR